MSSGNGVAIGIGPATTGPCRTGLPSQVLPPQDALVCDANDKIKSAHLLVATGAQNYGQNSYRIRQPFDFAGRTGKIVFDVDATVIKPEIGWVSIEVVQDPTPAPTFVLATDNDDDASVPRNGFELQFQNNCAGFASSPSFGLRMIQLYNNYQPTTFAPPSPPVCLATQAGSLNHFEARVSQQRIEIWATPFSADGKSFAAPVLLHSAAVNLPFSRGYVSITTHNHASIKYSENNTLDAWVARWDNVGFDGAVIGNWREFEVADSLTPGANSWNRAGPVTSVGYLIADAATGPAQILHLHKVDTTNAASARLSVSAWYDSHAGGANPSTFTLRYRFNGKAWHERVATPEEAALLGSSLSMGQISQMLDVPLADLMQGENTLEFVTVNVPRGYPPVVANVDLILTTK